VAKEPRRLSSQYSRDTLGNSYVSSDGESAISRSIRESNASHAHFLTTEDEAAITQMIRERMGDGGGFMEMGVEFE
jgi:hypothetical protein